MSIGKKRTLVANILPRVNWDGRGGFMYITDRVQIDGEWQSEQKNQDNDGFRAVVDMQNALVGWIAFTPKGPDTKLVTIGEDAEARWGEAPSPKHQLGLRVLMALDETIDTVPVRELYSCSIGFWCGFDALHDIYQAEKAKHPGLLPVIGIVNVVKTEVSKGASCEPVFAIEDWIERPPELPAIGIPVSSEDSKKKPGGTNMDDVIPF